MAFDPYASCPCGSGKKFKWCCQPIHVQIDRAFELDSEGQHDAALRLMDQVTAEHADNPEAWGRKAQLQYQNSQAEEAENTLQKAFDLNPKYPFGHWLKAMFRQSEGEVHGSLLLLRKAADLYDPEARDYLAQIHALIAENELKLNRPVAARAALETSIHLQPGNENLRKDFETVFGEESRLPRVARQAYSFQGPSSAAGPERRRAWDETLAQSRNGRLSEAGRAFEELTKQDENDAAAWYNLGVVRAWLGENARGVEALKRYVGLENDETKAADAWALAEVLYCGDGMEDEADYVENSVAYEIRDPNRVVGLLQTWDAAGRLAGMNQDQGVLTGLILEQVSGLTAEHAASQLPRLGSYLLIISNQLRLWNTVPDLLRKIRDEVEQGAGPGLSQPRTGRSPAHFVDVPGEALVFPVRMADKDEAQRRVQAYLEQYYEDKWIHRPLRSLDMTPPVDAAGPAVLSRKLRGVIRFIEDCAAGGQAQIYDFNRLRRKLGLQAGPAAAPTPPTAGQAPDISAMGAAELAALPVESATDEQLQEAFQTANRLDARDLAGRFAEAVVARPIQADHADRWPYYRHLTDLALSQGDTAKAVHWLDVGQKSDSEHNASHRQNDFDLRRGQVLAKGGQAEEAQNVFQRLIERAPSELRFLTTATEAMLSARQGSRALHFAQAGLTKAREKNDRDAEQNFMELVSAAERQQKS